MTKIILKKGRGESLKRFHPWVFSGAIAQVQGNPAEGDVVAVHDADGSFLAFGHYQVGSIAVRVLSFDADVMAPDFWEVMLARALQVRISCGLHSEGECQTTCYRLVHGEVIIFQDLSLTIMMACVSCRHTLPVCSVRRNRYQKHFRRFTDLR